MTQFKQHRLTHTQVASLYAFLTERNNTMLGWTLQEIAAEAQNGLGHQVSVNAVTTAISNLKLNIGTYAVPGAVRNWLEKNVDILRQYPQSELAHRCSSDIECTVSQTTLARYAAEANLTLGCYAVPPANPPQEVTPAAAPAEAPSDELASLRHDLAVVARNILAVLSKNRQASADVDDLQRIATPAWTLDPT